jgi:hypothetical protein
MSRDGANRPSAAELVEDPLSLMGRPTSAAWREEALARAVQMSTLLFWLENESELENPAPLVMAVKVHLSAAHQGAQERRKWMLRTMSGAVIERTSANLDAAEVNLLRLAPLDYLQSNVPNLLMYARDNLRPNDPRLRQLEGWRRRRTGGSWSIPSATPSSPPSRAPPSRGAAPRCGCAASAMSSSSRPS